MGVNFLIMWAAIDPITRAVIIETRVSRLGAAVMLRRGFRPSRLGAAVMLRRGFRLSRFGAAVMAMISPASGVWNSALDDLSFNDFLDRLHPRLSRTVAPRREGRVGPRGYTLLFCVLMMTNQIRAIWY